MYVRFAIDAPGPMTELIIDGRDLQTISKRWLDFAEREGLGASMVSNGEVIKDGQYLGRMSYNGKVWAGDTWADGLTNPIYDPRQED